MKLIQFFIAILFVYVMSTFMDFAALAESASFEVSRPVSITRMKDGSVRELSGKEGYHIEVLNQVGPSYITKLFDDTGKAFPGVYTVAADELDYVIQDELSKALAAVNESAKIKDPTCMDALEKPSENFFTALTSSISQGFGVVDAGTDREICGIYAQFKGKVPDAPLKQALQYYNDNPKKFANRRYIAIGDYSVNSRNKRFYLLDLANGTVQKEKVAHGSGSQGGVKRGDPDADGMINRCTYNGSRENMTRAGFFRVTDYYLSGHHIGKWPYLVSPGKSNKGGKNGMRLDGLSPGVNDEANSVGVVMHEAFYNSGGDAIMGRSYGCPAFVPGKGKPIIEKLRGGALYYSYVPTCKNEMGKVMDQVEGWQNLCAGTKPIGKDKPQKMAQEDDSDLSDAGDSDKKDSDTGGNDAVASSDEDTPNDSTDVMSGKEDQDKPAKKIQDLPKPSKQEPVFKPKKKVTVEKKSAPSKNTNKKKSTPSKKKAPKEESTNDIMKRMMGGS